MKKGEKREIRLREARIRKREIFGRKGGDWKD